MELLMLVGVSFWSSIAYIAEKQPDAFVLEESDTFFGGFKAVLADVIDALQSIKSSSGKSVYVVGCALMNSLDHGLPSARKRCYIIGHQVRLQKLQCVWPAPLPVPIVDDFLDSHLPPALPTADTALNNLDRLLRITQALGHDPSTETIFSMCGRVNASATIGKWGSVPH